VADGPSNGDDPVNAAPRRDDPPASGCLADDAATDPPAAARSQFLPGTRGVRFAVRADRFPAKFSLAVRPPASGNPELPEVAAVVRWLDPELAPDSRSFGTRRGADGLRWSSPVPASRRFGTAPADACRKTEASRCSWLKSGPGARSAAVPQERVARVTQATNQNASGASSRS
jgi:hypothetical protein